MRRNLGLGSALTVSLADAREAARLARKTISEGENPIERRRREQASLGLHTFGALADKLIEVLSPRRMSSVHQAEWKSTLTVDAAA
jgi:hypothetical protein